MTSRAETATAPTPPEDPRGSWDLPAFGEMPRVARLDPVVSRVLAPNPSPMTLDGTNTYVIAPEDGEGAVVLDPGPEDADHLAAVEQVLADRDLTVTDVVVTHHHHDHTEALHGWAQRWSATVHAPTREVAGPGGKVVTDGDRIARGAVALTAVATPGHTLDHVAYRLDHGPMLTGDHVLGRGTSVVAHPDGDLSAYLESLRTVLDLGPDALYPGHGPELTEDPSAVLAFYAEHRRYRESQVLATLAAGPMTPRRIVEVIYAAYDPAVYGAAEASTRATLAVLAEQGRVGWNGDVVHLEG